MLRNRFNILFYAFLILAILPAQISASAASDKTGSSFAGPMRLVQVLDTETPTPTETVTPTQTDAETPTATASFTATVTATATATAILNRYVASDGVDTGICANLVSPCGTINYAIGQAISGSTIYVAVGTYTGGGAEVVLINKAITLSGGWSADFTAQNGLSTIDGQGDRRGINMLGIIDVVVDHFKIQHGFHGNAGGGIYKAQGVLTLNNSIVSDNISYSNGGGIFNYGTLTINNSTISNNQLCCGGSYDGGGGIYNAGMLTINNSTISGNNIVGYFIGSAIFNADSAILNNSTVSGNTGDKNGEASSINSRGNLIVRSSTITGNMGGIYFAGGSVSLQNSILTGNTISGFGRDCTHLINSAGYNLIGNTCPINISIGDQVSTSANIIDPQLGPLQNNGGTTFTHALSQTSPAINAGNPGVLGSGGSACPTTDQRDVSRAGNGFCDIGAYELNSSILTISVPLSPVSKVQLATPTYKWTVLPAATRYQYQLMRGTRIIYTYIVDAAACGPTYCLITPTNKLLNTTYKWHVQAMIGGVWQSYSTYNTFTVLVPKSGLWRGETDFYVTNTANIKKYTIYITVYKCGIYNRKLTIKTPVPIVNNKYAYNTGDIYFQGTFSSPTVSKGSFGLQDYYLRRCGYIHGGPFSTIHRWVNPVASLFANPWDSALPEIDPALHDVYVFDLQ